MSGKKKGLSMEEKRKKMQEYFFETADFHTLKELEKVLPKVKGISTSLDYQTSFKIALQSIKEVLDGLVADNLVCGEKIGVSNYFWSLPSAAGHVRKKRLHDLETENKILSKKQSELDKRIQVLKAGKEDSEQRTEMLEKLAQLETLEKKYLTELKTFKECDPKAAKIAIEHANRWTDNILAVRSHCARNFGMDGSTFDQSFNIPEDFDSIEY